MSFTSPMPLGAASASVLTKSLPNEGDIIVDRFRNANDAEGHPLPIRFFGDLLHPEACRRPRSRSCGDSRFV